MYARSLVEQRTSFESFRSSDARSPCPLGRSVQPLHSTLTKTPSHASMTPAGACVCADGKRWDFQIQISHPEPCPRFLRKEARGRPHLAHSTFYFFTSLGFPVSLSPVPIPPPFPLVFSSTLQPPSTPRLLHSESPRSTTTGGPEPSPGTLEQAAMRGLLPLPLLLLLLSTAAAASNSSQAPGAESGPARRGMGLVPVAPAAAELGAMALSLNDTRRRLGSFQLCAPCTCCGGPTGACVLAPCCYAINCNIPNRPFGYCSFTPKFCQCLRCNL
ncbi:hypothetical protein BS78_03G380700 [Paspalum vaginatum]|nr:hypothetical protein BS78_03G380700 [Paspalum vaginatum]